MDPMSGLLFPPTRRNDSAFTKFRMQLPDGLMQSSGIAATAAVTASAALACGGMRARDSRAFTVEKPIERSLASASS